MFWESMIYEENNFVGLFFPTFLKAQDIIVSIKMHLVTSKGEML